MATARRFYFLGRTKWEVVRNLIGLTIVLGAIVVNYERSIPEPPASIRDENDGIMFLRSRFTPKIFEQCKLSSANTSAGYDEVLKKWLAINKNLKHIFLSFKNLSIYIKFMFMSTNSNVKIISGKKGVIFPLFFTPLAR